MHSITQSLSLDNLDCINLQGDIDFYWLILWVWVDLLDRNLPKKWCSGSHACISHRYIKNSEFFFRQALWCKYHSFLLHFFPRAKCLSLGFGPSSVFTCILFLVHCKWVCILLWLNTVKPVTCQLLDI